MNHQKIKLEQLIRQCKRGDMKGLSQVYQLYAGKLFAVCLKYSDNKEDAEDILQDGFLTIFNKINQYKNIGSFEGWMKRIMINTALQKYRKKRILSIVDEGQLTDTNDTDEVFIDDVISTDYLLSCVQELPSQYRLVFSLYVLDEYSHKEISEMMNISIGTSKSNLSRAKNLLKQKIENKKRKVAK